MISHKQQHLLLCLIFLIAPTVPTRAKDDQCNKIVYITAARKAVISIDIDSCDMCDKDTEKPQVEAAHFEPELGVESKKMEEVSLFWNNDSILINIPKDSVLTNQPVEEHILVNVRYKCVPPEEITLSKHLLLTIMLRPVELQLTSDHEKRRAIEDKPLNLKCELKGPISYDANVRIEYIHNNATQKNCTTTLCELPIPQANLVMDRGLYFCGAEIVDAGNDLRHHSDSQPMFIDIQPDKWKSVEMPTAIGLTIGVSIIAVIISVLITIGVMRWKRKRAGNRPPLLVAELRRPLVDDHDEAHRLYGTVDGFQSETRCSSRLSVSVRSSDLDSRPPSRAPRSNTCTPGYLGGSSSNGSGSEGNGTDTPGDSKTSTPHDEVPLSTDKDGKHAPV